MNNPDNDDNRPHKSYSQLMGEYPAHLVLKLDTSEPIEVANFVSAFTSLSSQYEKFIKKHYPDSDSDAQIFVREVRAGCIEADLIPAIAGALPLVIGHMSDLLVIEEFVRVWGGRLLKYVRKGGKDETATKSDLNDFMDSVAAIAADPKGSTTISAVYFEKGKKKIKAAIKIDTKQARTAERQISQHKRELENKSSADYKKALMLFVRSDKTNADLGKKSGERVVIEKVSDKSLPLIYVSDLAEQRIKHEIREAEDNVYKKGFVVDVNVEISRGNPVAYRITAFHDIFDLPD